MSCVSGFGGSHQTQSAGRSTLITFYYNLAPNPMKVALFLEETGLAYELKPVDTRTGEYLSRVGS